MMVNARIHQLNPLLSNQIAAGEVIERPASIVKELFENSVDANASKIEIDIIGAGKQLIRVRDNGCGIVKEDLALAFARHATSKIMTVADLAKIESMGFRGEALASIASVAKCRLVSKTQAAENAWQIEIKKDLSSSICPAAHETGTTLEVSDLFYNVPARRKFLKSERSEYQVIEETVKRLALAYPHITVNLRHDHKLMRSYPGISDLISEKMRIGKICGDLFLENATYFAEKAVGLQLRGWIGFPESSRRQSDCQYFFVNNRIVRDRLVNHLVKTLYQAQPRMIEGTYPCYVLYLNLDPSEVDVNVHPTKQEVRFRETRLVHDFILKSLEVALNNIRTSKPSVPINSFAYAAPCEKAPSIKIASVSAAEEQINFSSQYGLLEDEHGVYLIALFWAKNHLLTNYFKEEANNIACKALLFPLRLEGLKSLSEQYLTLLKTFGFFLTQKENGCFLIEQPAFLKTEINPTRFVSCIDALIKEGEATFIAKLVEILGILDLKNLPSIKLNALLRAFTQSQKRGWIYVKHEEIACNA